MDAGQRAGGLAIRGGRGTTVPKAEDPGGTQHKRGGHCQVRNSHKSLQVVRLGRQHRGRQAGDSVLEVGRKGEQLPGAGNPAGRGREQEMSRLCPLEPAAGAGEQEAPHLCPAPAGTLWPQPPGSGRTQGEFGSCVTLDKSPSLSGPQLPHLKPEPFATCLVC